MNRNDLHRLVMAIALAAGGIVVGSAVSTTNEAHGEVRGTAESPTFQAGSVPLLREISGTLRQMDGRLARLEVLAQKLQSSAASAQRSATVQHIEENNQ